MIKNKKWFWIVAVLISISITAILVKNLRSPGEQISGTSPSTEQVPALTLKTFEIGEGWGYEILTEGKTFIHQDQIPGVPGQSTFGSENEARRCGELVLWKLTNNQIPAITRRELDSLGIRYTLKPD